MQLQESKAEFDKMGIQMICVFREERDGLAGTKKASTESGFSPILLDSPAGKTKAYSQDDFTTYLIDKEGKVKAELSGTKQTRPTAKIILEKAKEIFSPSR